MASNRCCTGRCAGTSSGSTAQRLSGPTLVMTPTACPPKRHSASGQSRNPWPSTRLLGLFLHSTRLTLLPSAARLPREVLIIFPDLDQRRRQPDGKSSRSEPSQAWRWGTVGGSSCVWSLSTVWSRRCVHSRSWNGGDGGGDRWDKIKLYRKNKRYIMLFRPLHPAFCVKLLNPLGT